MRKLASLLLVVLFANHTHAQVINTIAGDNTIGYSGDSGPATAAQLHSPNEVKVDGAGNIYIADYGSNAVRKINPSGVISTFAGTGAGVHSGDSGPATAAGIYGPSDVAFDASGNMYIAEIGSNCIRKVNTSGIISTIAGTPGVAGFAGDGGLADTAQFNFPTSIWIDLPGNIYVTDFNNNRLRKIDVSGMISTIAGSSVGYAGDGGAATAAKFRGPDDVVVDNAGNIYIADMLNNTVRKINSSGIISTVAGYAAAGFSGDGGPATSAQLYYPYSICLDTANNLYITDNGNQRIRMVNSAGIINTIAGTGVAGYSGDGGPAIAATLNNTGGITIDRYGSMYVADYGNHVVREIYNVLALGAVQPIAHVDDIAIYPNPATDYICASINTTVTHSIKITLYNALGSAVTETASLVEPGNNIVKMNIGKALLAPGKYDLLFEDTKGNSITKQVIILR